MTFTDDEYNQRLKELYNVRISLDSNPIAKGYSQLLQKLAEIELKKDAVGCLLLEATVNKGITKAELESKEMELKMQMNQLFVKDAEVRSQKTSELRESLAETKCAMLMLARHHAELDNVRAENYYLAVQQLYNHIQSSLESLYHQIDIIRLEFELANTQKSDLSSTIIDK